ncbi:putative ubiquinone biosynthesis monooxgenase (Coq6) [Aspergillus saccharolyticus JOP 1030-1]|uniref:Ubiquinone biosynthesis monooxygenase COQ6, mitochondrial n=1 Tax=Aspergillus saccharolyticus JOP 1030-1 TaxID=1450539 RepID=A0A318ZII0_9EURO|nr:ubiquinone biosynthesis monooxgenase [Aspergillus saccharolyticus JOP 1030-1]PYH46735.1 ubiquinone biosynthesis monooxgenase [Aspergillus saccharolyticus JOP 1030-1]
MRSLVRSAARPYVCPSCQLGGLPARRRFASHSTPTSASPEIYDVVCVGGGPAGLGLLAALRASSATSKLKVALVETQDLQKARSWSLDARHYSNRVSSLTPSSVSFLQRIGVWDHVDTARAQPYQEMQVWDGETGSRITFDWSMESSPFEDMRTVATMTENSNLVRALLSRIAESGDENLSIFSNTTVSSISNGSEIPDGPDLSAWPILSLAPTNSSTSQPPKQIAARLLVGADGINSPVRRFADISTSGWDYDRHGVVATLSLSDLDPVHYSASIKTAYQRFLPALGGPIALLPLPNNNASLVWSTTPANAAYLKALPPRAFIAMVNAAFRLSMTDLNYMLRMERPASPTTASSPALDPHEDELTWRVQHTPQPRKPSQLPPLVTGVQEGTVASFPLRFRHASTYVSPRIALVGDAAHVIHPLAGQGLNLGLGDVAALAETVAYAATHGMDLGDILTLERYAGERFATNAKIGGACDVLHKLYNVPGNGPVAWARSFGLDVIDSVPFVKGLLMRGAQ